MNKKTSKKMGKNQPMNPPFDHLQGKINNAHPLPEQSECHDQIRLNRLSYSGQSSDFSISAGLEVAEKFEVEVIGWVPS